MKFQFSNLDGGGYCSPVVESIDIDVEKGFAVSLEGDEDLPDIDYNGDYEDGEY